MNKTPIYKKPASAKEVAKEGYKAMEEGKIEVIAGLPWEQRVELAFIPFIPKKAIIQRMKKQSVH